MVRKKSHKKSKNCGDNQAWPKTLRDPINNDLLNWKGVNIKSIGEIEFAMNQFFLKGQTNGKG